MNKILLTGGSGFIGRELLKEFSHENIVAVGRRSPEGFLGDFFEREMASSEDYSECLANVQSVIHLAGIAHNISNNPDYIDEVNVGAVMKLARQAAEAGVKRFIFISSIGVLGGYTKEPFNEDMPGNPCSQYGKSKLKAENLLRELSLEDRIDIVIIRPVLVYGEGAPGNFSKLLTMIKKTPLLPFGACFNKRSFISVSNLVDFIKICVTHPKAKNEIFCISDGNDISIKEFTNAISEGLNKNIIQTPVPTFLLRFMAKLIKQDSKIEQLIGDLQVDITKAQRLLGWSPPETMRETMKKLSR